MYVIFIAARKYRNAFFHSSICAEGYCKFGESGLVGKGVTNIIGRFSVQTPLGAHLGLGTQPHYVVLSDLWVKSLKHSD